MFNDLSRLYLVNINMRVLKNNLQCLHNLLFILTTLFNFIIFIRIMFIRRRHVVINQSYDETNHN